MPGFLGQVAQLVERWSEKPEVGGSIPPLTTSAWNVQMAASFLAAVPTLLIYIFLGRYFLRGMMSGALKE